MAVARGGEVVGHDRSIADCQLDPGGVDLEPEVFIALQVLGSPATVAGQQLSWLPGTR